MAKRKSYDDKFRASAVVMLQAAGYPEQKGALQRVSDKLGVPHPTLSRWYRKVNNPAPDDLVHEKQLDLIGSIKDELAKILTTLNDARDDASYKDMATAFGIFVDKLQLLENKPTSRVANEHSGLITVEERTARIAAIFDGARDRRNRLSSTDD